MSHTFHFPFQKHELTNSINAISDDKNNSAVQGSNWSVALLNAQSIVHIDKRIILFDFLRDREIDILFLTETWLNNKHPDGFLSEFDLNYSNIRVDRSRKNGGGIAMLCKNDIKFIVKSNSSATDLYEFVIVDIFQDKNRFSRFICVYRPLVPIIF